MLERIQDKWKSIEFSVNSYKDMKDTYTLGGIDVVMSVLEDSMVAITTILSSRYVGGIRSEVEKTERMLRLFSDTLDEWLECQRQWLYLETIFSAADIQRQLPAEAKAFAMVDKQYKDSMRRTKDRPNALVAGTFPGALEVFQKCNETLEVVQKNLEDYLETKRVSFPRFYFLSNDELLEILSQTRNAQAVQPHLQKCFDGIRSLDFGEDPKSIDIFAMVSAEGERVALGRNLKARGNVEGWLTNVELSMRTCIKALGRKGYKEYTSMERSKWIITGRTGRPRSRARASASALRAPRERARDTSWVLGFTSSGANREECFTTVEPVAALRLFYQQNLKQLGDLTALVLVALITIDVHNRDIVDMLADSNVTSSDDFKWQMQLRYDYDLEMDMVTVRQWQMQLRYDYDLEMDMVTVWQWQMQLRYDYDLEMDMVTVRQMQLRYDYDLEMDMVTVWQWHMQLRYDYDLEMDMVTVRQWQMQLRYDYNLEMDMVTVWQWQMQLRYDYNLEMDMVTVRQWQMQLRYDYVLEMDMGTVWQWQMQLRYDYDLEMDMVTVRQWQMQQRYDYDLEMCMVTAQQWQMQLRFYYGLEMDMVTAQQWQMQLRYDYDLEMDMVTVRQDYGVLQQAVEASCRDACLQPVPAFVTKVSAVTEAFNVVGGHAGGTHSPGITHAAGCHDQAAQGGVMRTLTFKDAMTKLHEGGDENPDFQSVHSYVLNPKSVKIGELYGEYNVLTNEWHDGLASSLLRAAVLDNRPDRHWVVFDGPVDAVWVEDMNTVLDDNCMLCLPNGERIKLNATTMRVLFEVQDLAVASPATVSRCGMVYVPYEDLGWKPFIKSWLQQLGQLHSTHDDDMTEIPQVNQDLVEGLFHRYIDPVLDFIHQHGVETIPSVDINKVASVSFIFQLDDISRGVLNNIFLFSIIWGLGGNLNTSCWDKGFLVNIFLFLIIWGLGGNLNTSCWDKFDIFIRTQFEEEMPQPLCLNNVPDLCLDHQVNRMPVTNYHPNVALTRFDSFICAQFEEEVPLPMGSNNVFDLRLDQHLTRMN
eukprot:gene2275-8543_t